jgi:hypothetical protein
MKLSNFTQENTLCRPSVDYYAFRHLPYAQYQAIQIIYALFYQLQALPHCSDDIGVIRHKTLFWLSEIQAAYKGTPTHPLVQDLQNLLKESALPQKEWIMILTAIEMQTDGLLLENQEEFEQYADRLYGSLYRLLMVIFQADAPINQLACARTLLSFVQQPDHAGVRFRLPDNAQTQVYTLFGQAVIGLKSCKPLRILARLYQSQAKQPMVHLAPLKLLGLSIRERLFS